MMADIYFAENTTYKESKDAHTGYDVLVSHVGVCDGLANALFPYDEYALNSMRLSVIIQKTIPGI